MTPADKTPTPRTDEAREKCRVCGAEFVAVEVSEGLERELTALEQPAGEIAELIKQLDNAQPCNTCDNSGCYPTRDRKGEPEPTQCEFCYTSPESLFNAKQAIKKALQQLFAQVAELKLALAEERTKLPAWMLKHGFATGHGDTTDDMLRLLAEQIAEGLVRIVKEPK